MERGFMLKSKIMVVMAVAVVLTVGVIIFNHSSRNHEEQNKESEDHYRASLHKSEQNNHWKTVSNEDVRNYLSDRKDFNAQKVKSEFSGGVVNRDTLVFFRFLDNLLKNAKDIPDSLEQARQYLLSVLPSDRAGQMLELYKKYVNYQVGLHQKFRGVMKTGRPDEELVNFEKMKAERRAVFGREDADVIFGASEKAEEYAIRRKMILSDDMLYGLEKERRLRMLHEAMWGDDVMPFDINMSPYSRYQEKLITYSRDLAGARTEAERTAMQEKFRREIFTSDELQRMDEANRSSVEEMKRKQGYYAREKEIRSDTSISRETQDMKIRELQDASFGAEAEAFRREESIQRSMEEHQQKAASEAKALPQNTTLKEAIDYATQKVQDAQKEAKALKASEQ